MRRTSPIAVGMCSPGTAPLQTSSRDLASVEVRQPNMMRFLFTSPTLRALHVDWETDARVSLEKFRMDFWRNKNNRCFTDLVSELRTISPEFRRWWASPFLHPTGDGVEGLLVERRQSGRA